MTPDEFNAMLEYAGQRAEQNAFLIMGGLEAGWNILRAGAGIARNLAHDCPPRDRRGLRGLPYALGDGVRDGAADEGAARAVRPEAEEEGLNKQWRHPHDPDARITKMKDGMRRVHLRGREIILKRLLLHGAGFNLALLMRARGGVGTPRSWQGRHPVLATARPWRTSLGDALVAGLTRLWSHVRRYAALSVCWSTPVAAI